MKPADSNLEHLLREAHSRLTWVHSSVTSADSLLAAFSAAGWRTVRVDVSACATVGDVATAFAALYPWPDWMPRSADGLGDWFTEMFESFETDRLCVVLDFGRSTKPIRRCGSLVRVLLNQVAHVRETCGTTFTTGETSKWELAIVWVSEAACRPKLPKQTRAITIADFQDL